MRGRGTRKHLSWVRPQASGLVLIGAHRQAVHRHTVKHYPIKEAVKEAVIQQSNADKACNSECRKPRISDASVAVRFDSHRVSGGKAPYHDVMIEFGQKVQKTIQQFNRSIQSHHNICISQSR